MIEIPKYWIIEDPINGVKQFEYRHLEIYLNSIRIIAVFEDHENEYSLKEFFEIIKNVMAQ